MRLRNKYFKAIVENLARNPNCKVRSSRVGRQFDMTSWLTVVIAKTPSPCRLDSKRDSICIINKPNAQRNLE